MDVFGIERQRLEEISQVPQVHAVREKNTNEKSAAL